MSNPHPAVEAVRTRALGMLEPGLNLALATDSETFAKGKKPAVLLAIARPHGSLVLAVDASEWDGVAVAFLAGFEPALPLTAHERAQQALTSGA